MLEFRGVFPIVSLFEGCFFSFLVLQIGGIVCQNTGFLIVGLCQVRASFHVFV